MKTQELRPWLENIQTGNVAFREGLGIARLTGLQAAALFLAAPRSVRKTILDEQTDRGYLQFPWLPLWPALAAVPLHETTSHPWTAIVREAYDEIRSELFAVRESFSRARYDSELNPKPWNTYYFYLEGQPVKRHLMACPRTAAVLSRIPHNALHVCFSAIDPGGSLHPHTGPTNASLTAHLGLTGCAGSKLVVAEREAYYWDGDVLVFDDSFVHWVENGGFDVRYTLMITFWHPELTSIERRFLGRVLRSTAG